MHYPAKVSGIVLVLSEAVLVIVLEKSNAFEFLARSITMTRTSTTPIQSICLEYKVESIIFNHRKITHFLPDAGKNPRPM
jgi:hypothetical protein